MRTSLRVWLFLLFLSLSALALATFLPNRHLWLTAWIVVLGINILFFWIPEWLISHFKASPLLGHDPYGLLRAWDQFEHPQTQLHFWLVPTPDNVLLIVGRSAKNAQVLISEKLLKSLSEEELSVLVKALARWAQSRTLFPLTLLTGLAACLPNFINRWMHKRLIDPNELLLLEKNLFSSPQERNTWAHLLMRWNAQALQNTKNLMLNNACSSLLPIHSENMECRIINLVTQFPPQR